MAGVIRSAAIDAAAVARATGRGARRATNEGVLGQRL